ncbi:FMN-binding negative transcriptional regulator [Rheinheimera sp.]|uniref:FMN-binding negative transcriptional regulator n=1 Tax=Rheinheimera sp. TaxID=1869214 RepID=UPI00307D789D
MSYPPRYFTCTDDALIRQFLQQHYFGLLLSCQSGLHYSPLPFFIEQQPQGWQLACHLARSNPQLQELDGQPVTVVIQGPHAFVSAACYPEKPAVSTWNYLLVEFKGLARLLTPEQTLSLARRQESHSDPQLEQSADYQQKLLAGIQGVQIEVDNVTARFKLSQNKNPQQHQAVLQYLQQHEQADFVWRWMQQPGSE